VSKVLVLQHVPYEGQGYLADYMRAHGIAFDVVELWRPYARPDLSTYAALIVMGGPMGVYEDFPSKDDELRVYPNENEGTPAKEIGYYTVTLTPEGQANPLFKGFDSDIRVLEWHGDTFDLPEGATLLATTPQCRNQAFAYGSAYGLIFHLEMSPEMVEGLVEANREWTRDGFALDEARLAKDARELAARMKRQCYTLLDNFFLETGLTSSTG
jgi:GMP synthase-like glutamine amidotransferase